MGSIGASKGTVEASISTFAATKRNVRAGVNTFRAGKLIGTFGASYGLL